MHKTMLFLHTDFLDSQCGFFSFFDRLFYHWKSRNCVLAVLFKTFPWTVTPPLEYSMGMQWVHCWLQAQHCVIITNTWNKQRHIFSFQNPNDIAKGKGRYGPYSEKCLNVLTPMSSCHHSFFFLTPFHYSCLSPHSFQFLSQCAKKIAVSSSTAIIHTYCQAPLNFAVSRDEKGKISMWKNDLRNLVFKLNRGWNIPIPCTGRIFQKYEKSLLT